MKKEFSIMILLSLVIAIALGGFSVSAKAVSVDTYYDVSFVSVQVYEDSTYGTVQKWTYDVTCLNSAPHAVSHVDFGELGITCNPPDSTIILELCGGEGVTEVDDVDPQLNGGTSAIKLDVSIDKGETKRIWFVVQGIWPTGTIDVWTKAGTDFFGPASVTGPDCVQQVIPEVPLGTITVLGIGLASIIIIQKRTKILTK